MSQVKAYVYATYPPNAVRYNTDASLQLVTGTDGLPREQFSDSQLALHLQMALYPGTLADYLAPAAPSSTSSVPPAKHCFHLQPSIRILLAMLDGVAYLHHQQIVHRTSNHSPRPKEKGFQYAKTS